MPASKKPSKPWRLLHTTPGSVVETKHRSEPETYRAVAAEKQAIAAGTSLVVRIRVEKWNVAHGCWEYYDAPYPED